MLLTLYTKTFPNVVTLYAIIGSNKENKANTILYV